MSPFLLRQFCAVSAKDSASLARRFRHRSSSHLKPRLKAAGAVFRRLRREIKPRRHSSQANIHHGALHAALESARRASPVRPLAAADDDDSATQRDRMYYPWHQRKAAFLLQRRETDARGYACVLKSAILFNPPSPTQFNTNSLSHFCSASSSLFTYF